MVSIGFMAWRIGQVLDVYQQFEWILDAGFDGIGFHASGGVPGQWHGIDPATCQGLARARLRRQLSRYQLVEIHAPFAINLTTATLRPSLDALGPILELAGDVGASVVTVHASVLDAEPTPESDAWSAALSDLDGSARRRGTVVGLEVTSGFEMLRLGSFQNVGVTLDVGHLAMQQDGRLLESLGGIGAVVRGLGGTLVHLHVHDVQGGWDHVEPGTGVIDFGAIAAAVRASKYAGGVMLELNPDRVSPEGIRRSRAFLAARLAHRSADSSP